MMTEQAPANPSLAFLFDFEKTPKWGTFFYYAKSREELIDFYERLLDAGFRPLEQPHSLGDVFLAELIDQQGREILLRSH